MNPFIKASVSAVEGFSGFDALFRRSVKKLIPRFQELVDNPNDYLAAQDVRIGPCIRWVTGIFFGVSLGFVLSCGIAFSALDSSKAVAHRSANEQILFWLIVAAGPILLSIAFLYWIRGGEVILRKDGVEFRLRRRAVLCPWEFFNASGEPEWLDKLTLAMTANPAAIDDAVLMVDAIEMARGKQIRTAQFRFRPDETKRITNKGNPPEIALRDLYKARLNEIASLILILSRELGKSSTTANPRPSGA